MRLLLDTHIWLWWLFDDPALSKDAREWIQNPANQVQVSVISLWEAILKMQLGKLEFKGDLESATEQGDIGFLPFRTPHARAIANLPLHHRDPFDRALLAQASSERLSLVTFDAGLKVYGSLVDLLFVS